jgi:hypothetical protein
VVSSSPLPFFSNSQNVNNRFPGLFNGVLGALGVALLLTAIVGSAFAGDGAATRSRHAHIAAYVQMESCCMMNAGSHTC